MQNATFCMTDLHHHGSAYFDYLKLRKRYFVDELGWDIPHNDHYEMDQYDNPAAYYSLAIHNGTVVGGVRAMPTDTRFGKHSYMLRDAVNGMIEGIPPNIMDETYSSGQVWEMTRLVIDPRLRTAEERNACLLAVADGLHQIGAETECQEYIGLTSALVARVLRQIGLMNEMGGRPYRCPEDGRQYGIIRIPVDQGVYAMAAQ